MADKSGLVAIVVALIGAGGVIAAKLIDPAAKPRVENNEPFVPKSDPAPPVTPPVAEPKTIKADDDDAPPKAKPATTDIAGTWVDAGGLNFEFTQRGTAFTMTSAFNGMSVNGQGVVLGREVRYTYQNSLNNPGQCIGIVQPGDALINFGCQQQNGAPYMMQLARAN